MDRTRLDGSQIFSWLLVGLALVLLFAILRPFWSALFLAAVLAGIFSGLHRRLSQKLGGRGGLAAGLLTILVLLAIVIPFGGIAGILTKEIIQVIKWVGGALQESGMAGLVQRFPDPLQSLAQGALDNLGAGEGGPDLVKVIQSQSGKAAAAATAF